MCKETTPQMLSALYVGEGKSLHDRIGEGLPRHHKWLACILHGATHICAMVVSGDDTERLAIETDLRHGLKPPLNDQ